MSYFPLFLLTYKQNYTLDEFLVKYFDVIFNKHNLMLLMYIYSSLLNCS